MKLPAPREELAGCVWFARILAKARLARKGELEEEYASRFCHPSGVDGQFISHFHLTREELLAICDQSDEEIATWFRGLDAASDARIQAWNHIAVNLGRNGFPMAERLPIALASTYNHLDGLGLETVFEVLEADEEVV